MKAAVFRGIGQIEVTDVPMPELEPGEVLIRVAYCGICGTDLEAFQTGMYEPGLILGHEFSGTVVEIGPGVTGWRVGDRVVVGDLIPCGQCRACRTGNLTACENIYMIGVTHNGGMAEYVKAPAVGLHRLPDEVNLRQGALVEPLTVALHGVRRSRLKPGDRAVVMGAGPIGLLTLQCVRLAGARSVIVTEVDPARAALAARLGATVVLNPREDNLSVSLSELTDGLGPDVIFICTGAPDPFAEAISLVRKGGQIFLLGLPIQPVEADFFSVVMGELSIEGSLAGWAEFPAAIDLIAQGRVDVEALVSHEIPLGDEVVEWFHRLSAPGSGAVKVLVRMES
ncbi:MAG: galactitol-1-phosphate 5-dehydrogenase [Anaerolineae bacterium]|nr:galactitol-1-phosphate 5-dehydrogenase [Anaerolineae bacterium]MCX8066611.1 galactitol-1-phosphate 5-dehydrogenase [Anaerolineae bacterium]MDW7991086.1 galactitol-1-phosphate 5-dehydrogenase [Anaerolineae bacterium]